MMHFCENILDTLRYYHPGSLPRFASVTGAGKIAKDGEKTAASTLEVGKDFGITGLIKKAKNLYKDSEKYPITLFRISTERRRFVTSSRAATILGTEYEGGGSIVHGGDASNITAFNRNSCGIAYCEGDLGLAISKGNMSLSLTKGFASTSIVEGYNSTSIATGGGSLAFTKGDLGSNLSIARGYDSIALTKEKDDYGFMFAYAANPTAVAIVDGKAGYIFAKGVIGSNLIFIIRPTFDRALAGTKVLSCLVDGDKVKENTYYGIRRHDSLSVPDELVELEVIRNFPEHLQIKTKELDEVLN